MNRVILITKKEYNKTLRKEELFVDHAIDENTLEEVILPCSPIQCFKDAYFDRKIMEWVIDTD
jgi:hypothetical protein